MRKRDVQVKFFLNTNEYSKLKNLSACSGYSMSAFIRARVLDDKRILIQDTDTIKAVYREMNAVGNNVNQIARIANSGGYVSEARIMQLLAIMRELKFGVIQKLKDLD